MGQQDNTVVLRVQLDEGKTEDQLKQLVLQIEQTRAAQLALTSARKQGQVNDAQFAQQTVELRTQLKAQTQEQAALTKNLDLYRAAQKGEVDSYASVQAALSLALNQQKELAGSASNSTEASQALTKQIADYRATLAATDEQQGVFFRNIGNYPKGESLEPLIQKLVQLQEIEKQLPVGSDKAAQAQRAIGFEYANLNKQAAAAGLNQKDLTAKLTDYGERVRPATAELAKLSLAQDEVAKTAGKESEEFAKIGFQIAGARKQVAAVPPELSKVNPAAEAATKALSDTATKGLGLLGEQGEKAGALLGKFRSGTDLLAKGMNTLKGAGETGSLGFKAIASGIALTGIGLFVIAISAVVSYFTQSAEGGKILAGILGALGAVVNVLTDGVTKLGGYLVKAATDPKAAFQDFIGFLKEQVVNRIASVGVLIDGIRNRDFKKITDSVIQFNLGITNGTDKLKAFGGNLAEAAKAGQALALAQRQLIKDRRELEIEDVKEQSRVAVLIRLSKDRTLTSQQQLANLREAGQVEEQITTKNIALQQRELAAIKEQIRQKGSLKAADLLADKAAKEKEIAQTLANQDETNARIKARESAFILQQRTEAAAAAKQRAKDAVAAKQTENELALLAVVKGSAAELALKQRAIDLTADMELAGEKKTVEQVKLVRAKAEGDKLDLLRAYQEKEIELAKKLEAARVAEVKREYGEAQQNLEDYLADKRAAIEKDYLMGRISDNTRQQQLNALDKAGYDAALVNATDYGQDKAKLVTAQANLEIKEAQRVKDEKKKIKDTEQEIQDKAFEAAAQTTDLVIELFGKESAAGKAALITKKTLALAEIAINTEKLLIANAEAGAKISAEAPPFTVPLGITYTVVSDALALAAAAASAAKILGFQKGGLLAGPSHAQGGIPFTVAGRAGFEAEGGEAIINRRSTTLFLPVLDYINQAGGGRPLTAAMPTFPHAALGAITRPVAQATLRGELQPIDHQAIGRAIADSLRKNPAVNRWVDFKEASSRNAFTDAQANS